MAISDRTRHLIPFEKGCKPGPGRPKGSQSFTQVLSKMLDKSFQKETVNPIDGEKSKLTAKEAMAMQLIAKALKGDIKAITRIMDRVEGKPIPKSDEKDESQENWLSLIDQYEKANTATNDSTTPTTKTEEQGNE